MTTATIHTKQTDGLRIKSTDDEIGLIEAVVNRMNVIDADGDRILSGAFTETLKNLDKEPVAMLWGHDSQQVIGKLLDAYEVGLENGEAVLVAKLLCNLDTERGRSAYSDIKMGAVAAWSIGFNCDAGDIKSVTDPDGQKVFEISALSLVEISAVLRGSSPGTSTLSVKESTTEKGAIPSHDTPTSDQNWDGSAVVASLPDTGDDAALYRDVFAWVNSAPDASPEAKSSYKFPHHDYPDTTANIKACQSIVGVLNGAMGDLQFLTTTGKRSGIMQRDTSETRGSHRQISRKTRRQYQGNQTSTQQPRKLAIELMSFRQLAKGRTR